MCLFRNLVVLWLFHFLLFFGLLVLFHMLFQSLLCILLLGWFFLPILLLVFCFLLLLFQSYILLPLWTSLWIYRSCHLRCLLFLLRLFQIPLVPRLFHFLLLFGLLVLFHSPFQSLLCILLVVFSWKLPLLLHFLFLWLGLFQEILDLLLLLLLLTICQIHSLGLELLLWLFLLPLVLWKDLLLPCHFHRRLQLLCIL